MFLKKFYNPANGEGGGVATEDAPTFTSVAEAMAKMGTKSDTSSPVSIPIDREVKVEQPGEEKPEAATAKAEPEPEKKPEPQKESPKEEPAQEQPKTVEQAKVPTVDEVLKNEQPNTILNKLGFNDEVVNLVQEMNEADPKILGIIQAWKKGTLSDYVRELSVDYSNMSAEEVMRHQLRQEYPKASPEALQALYESEVIERYKLDPDTFSEEEVKKGKLLLEAKADKYREQLVVNQSKYLLPEKPEPKKDEKPNAEEVQRQQLEAYRRELSENPYTKDILANKKITFGEGEEKFSYPVDPNSLLDVLTDGAKWVETMYDKDGDNYVPKIEHQMLVAAFAQDSKKFLSEYAKHLKSIGAKQVIEPIENASQPGNEKPAKSEQAPTSMAEAMARHGRKA